MYRECIDFVTKEKAQCVERLSDNAFIPFDENNIDYQKYLEWIAEGNEPEKVDVL